MAERYSICQDFLVPSRYCSKVTTGDVFTPTLLILHHVQCTLWQKYGYCFSAYLLHGPEYAPNSCPRYNSESVRGNMPKLAVLGITRNLYVGMLLVLTLYQLSSLDFLFSSTPLLGWISNPVCLIFWFFNVFIIRQDRPHPKVPKQEHFRGSLQK